MALRVASIVVGLFFSGLACSAKRSPSATGGAQEAGYPAASAVSSTTGNATSSAPTLSAEPPHDAVSCSPSVSKQYAAPSLAAEGRLRLSDGWKMHDGDMPDGALGPLDDSNWQSIDVPSVRLLPTKARQTVVWLRRRFDLPERMTPAAMALDLGARVGHSSVYLNGKPVGQSQMRNAPLFLPAPLPLQSKGNVLAVRLSFGSHVGGVRWTGQTALGEPITRHTGLVTRSFRSSVDGSSQTLAVLVPSCLPAARRIPLIVALPGWDGNRFSFAHSRLLAEAERRGLLVVTPDPRGNVLYTGGAEEGVLEAIDVVAKDFPVDTDRVFLIGVSMGGAGALQVGYHFPDRFAGIVAFYGDSRYEPKGYVRSILSDQKTADRYSVLLFHQNARNLPVLLVHARDDKVSPFAQSQQLADADRASELALHRLIAVDKGGHSLQVVEDSVDEVVALVDATRRQAAPLRVTFKSNAARYDRAYWLHTRIQTEGRFGQADVSINPESRTIRLHALGPGLESARIDLGMLGWQRASDLTVEYEGPWQATVILAGLEGSQRVRSVVSGQERTLRVDQGTVTLAGMQSKALVRLVPEYDR